MKLFEIHANPVNKDSDILEFSLIPGVELTRQLESEWINELRERIVDVFMETIEDHAEGLNIKTATDQLRIIIRLDNDGNMEVRCNPTDEFKSILNSIEDEETLNEVYGEFINNVGGVTREYLETIFSME